ncbi:MAG: nuclear transport factor 2 family protein [Alphaproteobacteria bacterium]
MKKLLLALFCLFPLSASAVDETPAVREALKEWVAAIEARDVARTVALYDKDSVMLSAFAIDPITTHEGLTQYYTKVVGEPGIRIVVSKQDIRNFGNVAVNTGLYRFQYTQDGEPMDIPARFSFVYVKTVDDWKIISHHSSIVPGAPNQE